MAAARHGRFSLWAAPPAHLLDGGGGGGGGNLTLRDPRAWELAGATAAHSSESYRSSRRWTETRS